MAILESIRKRSLFLILVIGLALFAFVISGVFTSNGGFNSSASTIGKVNGENISREEFIRQVETVSRQYGGNVSTIQAVNQVWNVELRNTLLEQQYGELGLSIGNDQIIEIIKSNPAFTSNPTFLDESGVFSESRFIEFIANLKESDPFNYAEWIRQEENLVNGAKQQMYYNLIRAGVVSTVKDGELEYKNENDKVDIRFVKVPFSAIADSTITVSKKDIQDYINAHKEDYEEEATRNIEYILFEETPSLEDDNAVRTNLEKYLGISYYRGDTIPSFADVTDIAAYVNDKSDVNYQDKFKFRSDLPVAVSDTLLKSDIGSIYGPYKDAESYKLSKVIAKTTLPDSVKTSYILVPFKGSLAANAQTTKTKEEARKTIDSLFSLVRNDKDKFTEVADTINTDATRGKGGDLGWIKYSNISDDVFDRDFSDFMFFNKTGDIDVVETKFGFHIIRIDDQRDFKEAIKVATIENAIEPSEKTINDLFTTTTKFEIEANEKDFQQVAQSNNYTLRPVNRVKELDENLPGIGNQRGIVQWAYNKETKVGDIKRFNLPNGYAVVRLLKKTEAGVAAADDVSARVLPIIRRERKAEIIKKRSNSGSLQDFATQNGVNVNSASAISMNSTTVAGAGREPKLIGTAFGLNQGETSGIIVGETGVYMVEVTKREEAPALENYTSYSLNQKTRSRGLVINAVFNALREAADIEDNRADFY